MVPAIEHIVDDDDDDDGDPTKGVEKQGRESVRCCANADRATTSH